MKCKICGMELKSALGLPGHLRHRHKELNYSSKDYYDKHIKTECEETCPVCGKPNKFYGAVKGYSKSCSPKCAQNNSETKKK